MPRRRSCRLPPLQRRRFHIGDVHLLVAAIVAEGAAEAMHVPLLGNVTVARRYDGLTADQLSCFQGMHNDLRAVGGQSAATAEAGDELLKALLSGSPMRWRSTVRSVERLLADVPTGSASSARARLETFIAENCDLLDGNELEDRLSGRAGS